MGGNGGRLGAKVDSRSTISPEAAIRSHECEVIDQAADSLWLGLWGDRRA